jgi:hypothetical protein
MSLPGIKGRRRGRFGYLAYKTVGKRVLLGELGELRPIADNLGEKKEKKTCGVRTT